MEKQTIYWDADDVILNTLEASTALINAYYNIPNNQLAKSSNNAKDWKMNALHRGLTTEQLLSIFESGDFWDTVEIKESFYGLMSSKTLENGYNHVIITKGTPMNLVLKKKFFEDHLDFQYKYIGLVDEKKEDIVEEGSIQIDDNIENLIYSKAAIKILLTNNKETVYNNAFGHYDTNTMDNLYVVNDLAQVKQILEFNLENNLAEI